jgi:drug/metabolite transporter (DMT)-like permease
MEWAMVNTNIYLLVTISAFFWGANFLLGGYVINDIPPLWAAAMRFVLGAALMFAIAGVKRENLIAPLRKHIGIYVMLGVVGIVAFNLFFFYALRYTSANNGALIMATNPLFTTLLAVLILGERPSVRHLIALPIALAGVAVVVTQGKMSSLLALQLSIGDVLMLCADIFFALYNVLCRRYMPHASPLVNTTWIMTAGAVVLLSIALGSGAHLPPIGINAGISMAAGRGAHLHLRQSSAGIRDAARRGCRYRTYSGAIGGRIAGSGWRVCIDVAIAPCGRGLSVGIPWSRRIINRHLFHVSFWGSPIQVFGLQLH